MKLKKILLIGLLIIAILSNMNFVYASDSFSVTLITDKQIYTPGETVIVTVKLSGINSEKGIYGLVGNLEYKTNVFEEIISDDNAHSEDITALNGWGNLAYNSSDTSFSISNSVPAKNSQQIMKIALKIKEGAPLGNTVIMLKNLVGTNSDSDVIASIASVQITIQEKQTPEMPTLPPTVPPTIAPIPTQTLPTIAPTATPSNGKLPQTGIDDTIKFLIVGSLIASGISYIAYKRYKGV